MWAFGQEYLSLNISNTLALGMGLNSGLDYIYCAWILNGMGDKSPISPYLYSIYVCGVHARGGHCMSSSFFGTLFLLQKMNFLILQFPMNPGQKVPFHQYE